MNELDFTYLREMLHKRSGLSLSVEKRYLVESRLASLCRRLSLATITDVVHKLRHGDEDLARQVVEAMTTNETLFFRDSTPFDHFRKIMLPALIKSRGAERSLRIWCAAASTGQEPYSLAMILDEVRGELAGWRFDILGTDIARDVLAKAREAVYSQFEIQRGLPIKLLLQHFDQEGDKWRLKERLRSMITFREMNLLEPSPALGQFDIIFCRNVLIYFDLPTKAKVLKLMARHLRPDGFLTLGAAETVIGITDEFAVDRENRGLYRLAPPQAPAAPGGLAPASTPAHASAPGARTAAPSAFAALPLTTSALRRL
jgi:chemotaxis protein methyltransferase CheR